MIDNRPKVELIKTDAVVMESDGTTRLSLEDISKDGTNSLEELEKLNLKRKKLVLGLDGYDEHSLEEANNIINRE